MRHECQLIMPRPAARNLAKTYRGQSGPVSFKILTPGGRRVAFHGPPVRGRRVALHGPPVAVRVPSDIGSKSAEIRQKIAKIAPRPRARLAQARAMFLSNNYVKNGMNVSRETLPNN